MNPRKRRALEASGFRNGDAADFLGMSDEERPLLDQQGADVDTNLAERLGKIIGIAEGLPSDLAEQHDHYLHGRPKK
ncbi:MAG: hypothetical protein WD872_20805 [Pirellulaceae bacterium]